MLVLGLLSVFFFSNPFNRGNFKLRWNQQKMAKQIQQGLIDEGIVNPRNKSYGVEVADIFPDLSEQSLSVFVEVVGASPQVASFNLISMGQVVVERRCVG